MNIWVEFAMVCLSFYAINDLVSEYIKKNKSSLSKNKRLIISWIIFFAIFTPYYFYSEENGIDDDQQYYVNMFTSADSQKNYRVPASVHYEEDGLYLGYVDWSNSGYSEFDLQGNVPLQLNKRVLQTDDDEKEWYVELTNKKVEK